MIEGQEGVTWDDWARLARLTEETGLEGLFAPITTRRSSASTRTRSTPGRRSQGWPRSPSGSGSAPSSRPRRFATRACSRGWPSPSTTSLGVASTSAWGPAGTSASTSHGFPFLDARERFDLFAEQVEIVVRSWTEETFDHDGTAYELWEQTALPRPFQQPTAARARRDRKAALRGAGRPLRHRGEHARRLERRAPRAEAAPGPRLRETGATRRRSGFSVMTACFLGTDRGEVLERLAAFLAIRGRRLRPRGAPRGAARPLARGHGRRGGGADRGVARARRDPRLPPAPEPRRRRDGAPRRRSAASALR